MIPQAQPDHLPLKAVIIEDEEPSRENLEHLLQHHCPEVLLVGSVENLEAAPHCLQTHQPDVVFLDVCLQGKNSIDWLQSQVSINFSVVFVSAHAHYGVQAVKTDAVDYLLKPIRAAELKSTVKRLVTTHQARLASNGSPREDTLKIAIAHAMGTSLIPVDEIIYLEADNNYTTIHRTNDKPLLVAKPLKDFEMLLAETSIFRIHKTHMINLNYLELYSLHDGGRVVLSNGREMPIARRRISGLLDRIRLRLNVLGQGQ